MGQAFRALAARAFTMVELIVVVVVMTVIAATILPRFAGNEARAAEQEARNVKEFFSSVGARAALTSQSLQVEYRATSKQFVMKTARATDPANFASEREWLADPLLAPVTLSHIVVKLITTEGLPGDALSFSIELPVGKPRPAMVVVLAQSSPGEKGAWRVELASTAVQAKLTRTDPLDAAMPLAGTSVDLDDAGMGENPW